jgi:hypothetical protein
MTATEAFDGVSQALTDLRLLDCFGEPIIGLEAMGMVDKVLGKKWNDAEEQFYTGSITPKEYHDRAVKLIRELDQYLYLNKLERKLASLKLDQIELDIQTAEAQQ